MKIVDSSIQNLKINRSELFTAERKVADYILDNLAEAVHMNVAQLATSCGVSSATVIRMCKHLGFKGYYQLRLNLAQNMGEHNFIGSTENLTDIDTVSKYFYACSSNMRQIGTVLDDATVKKVVKAIVNANSVHFIAFDNTTNVVQSFAFRLSRMKIATTSSYSNELALSTINLSRYGDVVIGISHSGGSDCVIKALTIARAKGLTTIAITDTKGSPVEDISDYTLCTTIEHSNISIFGVESHVNLLIVTDLLVFLIAKDKKNINGLELFLSETQIDN